MFRQVLARSTGFSSHRILGHFENTSAPVTGLVVIAGIVRERPAVPSTSALALYTIFISCRSTARRQGPA